MRPFNGFNVARLPEIRFGSGSIRQLPEILAGYGGPALLVTGRSSFRKTIHWAALVERLAERAIGWELVTVEDEPSPALVDQAVAQYADRGLKVVAGIGGGSVLDAAKAISGLLLTGNPVLDHLEGVGRGIPYQGPALPWVAVPTTAGTGSEATKNAVLSQRGEAGYKKSFRHNLLVAEIAIVDPDLLGSCPKPLIAANGMDAFTQLLESYVSSNASPFTDALAASGMAAFRDGFWQAWEQGHPDAAAGYERIAYASLCSGITLAQAGLGSVHGLASPLGAFFPIPHGVVCGTLVAEATRVNTTALRQRDSEGMALQRYARAGEILTGRRFDSPAESQNALIALLDDWTERLSLPRLGKYGMTEADLPRVVANCRGGSMKTNPILLTDEEVAEVARARL